MKNANIMQGNGYSPKTSPPGRPWETDFQSVPKVLARPN